MISDVTLGPMKVRLEILPMVVLVGVLSSVSLAVGLFVALVVHEVGHFAFARLCGGRVPLYLQLTGGDLYARGVSRRRDEYLVLLAGPAASLALALASITGLAFVSASAVRPYLADTFYAATVWTVYQLSPYPPLDGGHVLRRALVGRGVSATRAWRASWALGLVLAAILILLDSRNLQPVVLLSGVAIILGRAESGYVRHLDAYAAWERGDHRAVLMLVRGLPDYLDRDDRVRLLELGLFAGRELQDETAVAELVAHLPASRPVVIQTAEWLLGRQNPTGARVAQRALDALDAERVQLARDEERERFADLAFRYALFEARELRVESALGLIDRAVDLGFRDIDRVEADAHLATVRASPRWAKVRARFV